MDQNFSLGQLMPSQDAGNPFYSQGIIGNPASAMSVPSLAGQNQAQAEDFLKGISMTQLGRLQVMGRLEQQFGPEYRMNPQAQAMMKSFEDKMSSSSDVNSLQKLVDQSRRIEDYLTSMTQLAPSRSYQRVAG